MSDRDYDHEYKSYHARPEQKKRRAMRNKARREALAKGVVKKGDGKDIDHKDRNPMNTSPSNLRVQSESVNRSRNSPLGDIREMGRKRLKGGK